MRNSSTHFTAGFRRWFSGLGAAWVSLTAMVQAADGPPSREAARVVRDVAYLEAGRLEKLDLYLPTPSARERGPAVVLIHGGGWISGDKADPREQEIAAVYAGAGYVCASINYRVGEGAWPTNLEDCRNAVRFLRQHAAEYRIDPARIAVHGNSAGGHLALMTAFTGYRAEGEASDQPPKGSSRVAAVIDFYGRADLLNCLLPAPDGTPTSTVFFTEGLPVMLGSSLQQNATRWKEASPLAQVTPAAPPVLIVQGLSDPGLDYTQSIRLANALRAYGVEHQLLLLEGIGHGFDLESWHGKPMQDLRPVVLTFLDRHLKNSPP